MYFDIETICLRYALYYYKCTWFNVQTYGALFIITENFNRDHLKP